MNKAAKALLFKDFPKVRPSLPDEYKKIFETEYQNNREGKTPVYKITRTLEAWMHRKVAGARPWSQSILEIGAGTLNHVKNEPGFGVYDFVEPQDFLFRGRPELSDLNKAYKTIHQIRGVEKYDRVFSIAVLEHITDLPSVVARTALLLKSEGLFQAGIPSEGGFLWGFSWRTTTGVSFRLRHGLNYKILMRHEHVNKASEIESVVRNFFDKVHIQRFPLPLRHLSFYEYIEASGPKKDLALNFLKNGEGVCS